MSTFPPTRRAVMLGAAALTLPTLALPTAGFAQEAFAAGDQIMGDPEASVEVIEYASLTCPHCASFHKTVWPTLKRDFVDTGKVKFVLREVYFDRLGLWAGAIARCDGPTKYFGMIDLLLKRQSEWKDASDPIGGLIKMATLGGIPEDRATECIGEGNIDQMRGMVENYQTYRDDPNLTGTPSLVVNGRKVERPSAENLAAAIEAALGS